VYSEILEKLKTEESVELFAFSLSANKANLFKPTRNGMTNIPPQKVRFVLKEGIQHEIIDESFKNLGKGMSSYKKYYTFEEFITSIKAECFEVKTFKANGDISAKKMPWNKGNVKTRFFFDANEMHKAYDEAIEKVELLFKEAEEYIAEQRLLLYKQSDSISNII